MFNLLDGKSVGMFKAETGGDQPKTEEAKSDAEVELGSADAS